MTAVARRERIVGRVGEGIVVVSGDTPTALDTLEAILETFDDDADAFVWLLDDHDKLGAMPLIAVRRGRHEDVLAAALAIS